MGIACLLPCALALSCSVPAQLQNASRPTPEAAARAMVDTALPAVCLGGSENLSALSQDEVKEPAIQLISATQKSGKTSGFEGAMSVFQYRAYIRPLFKAGTVQIEKLKQYTFLLNGPSPKVFADFSAAPKAKCKEAHEHDSSSSCDVLDA